MLYSNLINFILPWNEWLYFKKKFIVFLFRYFLNFNTWRWRNSWTKEPYKDAYEFVPSGDFEECMKKLVVYMSRLYKKMRAKNTRLGILNFGKQKINKKYEWKWKRAHLEHVSHLFSRNKSDYFFATLCSISYMATLQKFLHSLWKKPSSSDLLTNISREILIWLNNVLAVNKEHFFEFDYKTMKQILK